MSFIKSGNKRSLWYCVRRRNNPQSGMLKFWKVCKSGKFRPSINLQSMKKKNWKNSLWDGSGYGGLVNSLFAALQATRSGDLRLLLVCVPWGRDNGMAGAHGAAGHPSRSWKSTALFIIKENAFICWWHPETMSRNTKQRVGEREGEGKPGIISAWNWMKCWEEGDYFAH